MHSRLVVAFGAQPASDMLKTAAGLQSISSDVCHIYMRRRDVMKSQR